MADKPKALHVQVAEKLIDQLKAGTAPWQKPWNDSGDRLFQLPYNAVTGNRYKGINIFSLLLQEYDDPRWMTFKQAADNNWKVMKGEKGALIQFVKLTDLVTQRDEGGKPVLDSEGKPIKVAVTLNNPVVTSAWVFNAQQVDGIPQLRAKEGQSHEWEPLERAEQLVRNTAAKLNHVRGDQAYYNPVSDRIVVPAKEQFDSPDKYYATVLHEIGHWTGHISRLDRTLMDKYGTQEYAREELRAEIASMIVGQELQIGHDPAQHVAYVNSWIKILQDTPFEIHSAAADAEKIFSYLMDFERKQDRSVQKEPGKSLNPKDEIPYNGSTFKVHDRHKDGRLHMEVLDTGNQFMLSKTDGLFNSLMEAKKKLYTGFTAQKDISATVDKPLELNPASSLKR